MPDKNNLKIINEDPHHYTAKQISSVYNSVNFTISEHFMHKNNFHSIMYPAGTYGLFVEINNELVGAARIMSDQHITTWVAELCVKTEWQNQGVGKVILRRILEKFEHTAIYLESFQVSKDFFHKQGIKIRPQLVACSRAPTKQ